MIVTFITHSTFVVETEQSVLIFDYFKGELPEFDTSKEIYFFASHKHGDHYNPVIFDYARKWKHVHFILSKEIRPKAPMLTEELSGRVLSMRKDQEAELGALKIRTLRSTDLGVAYIVETEGKRLYHAGDLNWWHWEGEDKGWNYQMEQNYKKELDKIKGEYFHLAFVPVDPRLGEAYYLGVKAFAEAAFAEQIFPMHFWGDHSVCGQLKARPEAAAFAERIVEIREENQQWRY